MLHSALETTLLPGFYDASVLMATFLEGNRSSVEGACEVQAWVALVFRPVGSTQLDRACGGGGSGGFFWGRCLWSVEPLLPSCLVLSQVEG
jgi:hypothetical protein